MGQCIGKLGHECGSRQGLQLFQKEDGNIDGFCFSCKTYVPDPLGDNPQGFKPIMHKVKTPEEIREEIGEIDTYPIKGLPDRKIGKATCEYFGVKVGVDEERGEDVVLHYYPYYKNGEKTAYKVRLVENKRIWSVGDMSGVDLFGWEQAKATGAKRLYITEGEIDAMSLFSVIMQKQRGTEYEGNLPAVVSIPHGAASAGKDVGRLLQPIRAHFKEIVLVYDMDEAGRKAVEETLRILPEALSVNLPKKDVNECVLEGNVKALFNAVVFNATAPKNTRLILGSELKDLAKQRPEMGLSWPWKGMTKLTRGIRRGEVYYFGSGVKMGKSELVNAIAVHMMTVHDTPVLLVKPEEDKAKTYKMLVGKAAGKIFHDPDIPFDEEAFDKAEPLVGNKAIIVDSYQFVDWNTLKGDIRYAVEVYGVKDIIIDPITVFCAGLSSGEVNDFLILMSQELAQMSKDLDFTAYIFCHLKAPTVGESHERGGEVMSTQFTGSRGMMRSCHMMVGMSGNKNPDLPEEDRNCRTLTILEERSFGAVGKVPLYWEKGTGRFIEL